VGKAAQSTVVDEEKGVAAELEVEVVKMVVGPSPVLNRPVVLNAEGKVDTGTPEDQRSFLQKYWWAIAIFLLVQLVIGGGGGE